MQEQGPIDRDAVARFGRSVRGAVLAAQAFMDALLDSSAWARFGSRVLKRVLIVVVLAAFFAGVVWKYSADILLWLLIPAGDSLSPFGDGRPVFTGPADMFGVTVSLTLRGAVFLVTPAIIISVYTLFSQWMPPAVRTFIKLFVPSLYVAFIGGMAFVYYVILPTSLRFLLGFGKGVALPLITVTDYFDLVTSLMFWMGVLFELPLAMYLLSRLGLVRYRRLKQLRLVVWLFGIFFAAIITPTVDYVTWLLVLVPFAVLYEFGLFLAWATRPEDGDYLFVKHVWAFVMWTPRRIARGYHAVRLFLRRQGL